MDTNASTLSHSDDAPDSRRSCLGIRVLAHPELRRVGDFAPLLDSDRDGSVKLDRNTPMFRDGQGQPSGALLSERVSRTPLTIEKHGFQLRIRWQHPSVRVELDGTVLDGEREITLDGEREGVTLLLGKHVALWLGRMDVVEPVRPIAGLIGESALMRRLRKEILRVADTDVPVLLRGETGVGKEVVAESIHALSSRAAGDYVAVNVAAVPQSMAAAELFGHRRGAFTGATGERAGYFVQAHQGTLFLDEIGDISADVQALLLRAIEHGTIQPLGGGTRQVNVRLIAATDSNLEAAIANGDFREPLMRRFAYEMHVPPLRKRRDDIGLLFFHLVRQQLRRIGASSSPLDDPRTAGTWVPAAWIATLARHDWPGNVRELANVALQFALRNRDRCPGRVEVELEALVKRAAAPTTSTTERLSTAPTSPLELTDPQIETALAATDYSAERAAERLGVSRSFVFKRIAESTTLVRAHDLSPADIQAAWSAEAGNLKATARRLRVSPRALTLQIKRLGLTGLSHTARSRAALDRP